MGEQVKKTGENSTENYEVVAKSSETQGYISKPGPSRPSFSNIVIKSTQATGGKPENVDVSHPENKAVKVDDDERKKPEKVAD